MLVPYRGLPESELVEAPTTEVRVRVEVAVVAIYCWAHSPCEHRFFDGSGTFELFTDIWKSSLSTTLTKDPAEYNERRFTNCKVSEPECHGPLAVLPDRLKRPAIPPPKNVMLRLDWSGVEVPARPEIVIVGVHDGRRGTVLKRATVI